MAQDNISRGTEMQWETGRDKGMPFLKTLLILLFPNYLQATLSFLQEPTATITTSGTHLVYSMGHHLAYVCHGS